MIFSHVCSIKKKLPSYTIRIGHIGWVNKIVFSIKGNNIKGVGRISIYIAFYTKVFHANLKTFSKCSTYTGPLHNSMIYVSICFCVIIGNIRSNIFCCILYFVIITAIVQLWRNIAKSWHSSVILGFRHQFIPCFHDNT